MDGQTEVVNCCLSTYLSCFVGMKPKSWPQWLNWAEFWYNTNYHASTKTTPFKALYGRDPPTILRGDSPGSGVEELNQMIQERNLMLDEIRDQLLKAQNRMKTQVDKHRRELELAVGEKVFLKIQPYRLRTLAQRQNQKLSPRFYGPFEVIEKVGNAAYRLLLPQGTNIHPVFHVSLLKRCVSPTAVTQPLPTCLNEDWELQVVPEKVLATRSNAAGQQEVLIKWLELPDFESSWELRSKIEQEFPSFHLGDKVDFQGGVLLETPDLGNIIHEGKEKGVGPYQAQTRRKQQNSARL